jgi:hypothetical protein
MLGPTNVVQSTDGSRMSGVESIAGALQRSSWSTSIRIGARQAAHLDAMRTVTGFPTRRPCTKGDANASSAQAP